MTLNKRAIRSVKNNIAFYLISTILTVLASAIIIAAISTGRTLTSVVISFEDKYKAEDAEFTTYTPIDGEDIDRLEKEYDIVLEKSMYKDVDMGDSTLRIFPVPEKVNLFDVREGTLPADGEALITEKYAENNDINVGDVVRTDDNDEFVISGYTTKTDYIYMVESLVGSYRDNETFGILIVNRDDYEKLSADEVSYYSVIYNSDNSDEVRKKLNDDYIISSYMAQSSNQRICMPINQGAEVYQMALMFAPVVFIIVIVLIVLVLGRYIKNEQDLLGTFLALGVSKRQIITHYTRYALIPGVIGSVLGTVLSVPLTYLCSYIYMDYDFEVLEYKTTFDIASIVCALILPGLLYSLTVIFEVRRLLKKTPTELLRHDDGDRKSIGILKNKETKTSVKLKLRSAIGHPGRSIVTVIGVTIAAVCMLVGLMMKDSKDDILENGIIDSSGYKYLYALNYLADEAPSEGEALLKGSYEVDGNTVLLSFLGISSDSEYFPDRTNDNVSMDLSKYYITSAGAETYGVSQGDDFTFRNIADLEEHTVKIAGIVDDNTKCAVYTSLDNAAELLGVQGGCYNCIVSDTEIDIDMQTVASKTVTIDNVDTIKDLTGILDTVVLIIIILGIIIGIFVLYLIMNMIAGENKSNISVMKVLGFSGSEISSRILKVNHPFVVIGFIIAIPLAYLLCKAGYADTIENFGMMFTPVVRVKSLIISFVLTWITYEAALFLQKRKIKGIDMVSSLKENNRNE